MSLQPRRKIHFDDWLAAERAATQGRSEYVDGEIFAMAGGSEAHNLICGNLLRELGNRFKGRPCYVYTSNMKVRTESANLGAYPDAMAVCREHGISARALPHSPPDRNTLAIRQRWPLPKPGQGARSCFLSRTAVQLHSTV